MKIINMPANGRITIPVALRRKYGINAGMRVGFVENNDNTITVVPCTPVFFEKYLESFPGKRKATKTLLKEGKVDRERKEGKYKRILGRERNND